MKSSQGPRVAFSEATVQLSQKKEKCPAVLACGLICTTSMQGEPCERSKQPGPYTTVMGGLRAAKRVGLVSLVVEIGYVVSIRVDGDSTT